MPAKRQRNGSARCRAKNKKGKAVRRSARARNSVLFFAFAPRKGIRYRQTGRG